MLRLPTYIKTAGLWLPSSRLANPLGRFGVCGGGCCEDDCSVATDCLDFSPTSTELEVVLPDEWTDDTCSWCGDMAGTYNLTHIYTASNYVQWTYSDTYSNCTCGGRTYNRFFITFWMWCLADVCQAKAMVGLQQSWDADTYWTTWAYGDAAANLSSPWIVSYDPFSVKYCSPCTITGSPSDLTFELV